MSSSPLGWASPTAVRLICVFAVGLSTKAQVTDPIKVTITVWEATERSWSHPASGKGRFGMTGQGGFGIGVGVGKGVGVGSGVGVGGGTQLMSKTSADKSISEWLTRETSTSLVSSNEWGRKTVRDDGLAAQLKSTSISAPVKVENGEAVSKHSAEYCCVPLLSVGELLQSGQTISEVPDRFLSVIAVDHSTTASSGHGALVRVDALRITVRGVISVYVNGHREVQAGVENVARGPLPATMAPGEKRCRHRQGQERQQPPPPVPAHEPRRLHKAPHRCGPKEHRPRKDSIVAMLPSPVNFLCAVGAGLPPMPQQADQAPSRLMLPPAQRAAVGLAPVALPMVCRPALPTRAE